MDNFLKSVNLSETQNNTLMSAITTEEVKAAITKQINPQVLIDTQHNGTKP